MVSGLDVLQAISASYHLASELTVFARSLYQHSSSAIPRVVLRLEDDANLLGHLDGFFKPEIVDAMEEDDIDHLRKVFRFLLPFLQDTYARINNYSKNTVGKQIQWSLLGDDLEKAESELYQWTQRLQARLSLLPTALKGGLLSDLHTNVPQPIPARLHEVLTAQQEMQNKYESFKDLSLSSLPNLIHSTKLSSDIAKDIPLLITKPAQTITIEDRNYLVEYKRFPVSVSNDPEAKSKIERGMVEMAAIFSTTQPLQMCVLRTHAFFETSYPSAPFGLLYDLPPNSTLPRSLYTVLRDLNSRGQRVLKHSLDQRFELVRQIATAILFIHSIGWLHKGIQAYNIYLFNNTSDPERQYPEYLGISMLAGFDYTRKSSSQSTGDETGGKSDWKKEIAQHPSRNTSSNNSWEVPDFTAEHDIYALGVIMIEIGRWKALESYPEVFAGKGPIERKTELEKMASTMNITMGSRYVELTLRCLKILDQGRRAQGARRFICDLVGELEELSATTRSTYNT